MACQFERCYMYMYTTHQIEYFSPLVHLLGGVHDPEFGVGGGGLGKHRFFTECLFLSPREVFAVMHIL